MTRRCLLPLLLGCALAGPAWGQSGEASPAAPEGAPRAVAVFAETAPVLDGAVLDDPAWAAAVPLSGFRQTTPEEGRPASERTEVRLLYTATALYIGVVCHDRQPGRIVVSDSRRDAPLDDSDSFQLILDTYRDGQNGFLFGTNPAGIEYDAQVTNEGQGSFGGSRQQSGSGGGLNVNWDGSWTVRTHTGDYGWSAEFEIPFRTLRFPGGGAQAWGVNFQRTLRRRNEVAFWAPLPRQYNLMRLSYAGRLDGLEVPDPRNLTFTPYALATADRDYTLPGSEMDAAGDVGADLKYSITPSLTLDLTYNTDFAQVEVDEQQVNLDRFSLFFPEKRPFFLENAGLFSVGVSEFAGQEVELFFSRRIGIGPGGEVIPILGGARVSGQVGGLSLGLLDMQTEAVRGVAPANNFAVARLRKDLPNRSAVGALATNRVAMGDLAGDDDYNQTVALDGRLGLGRYGVLTGFVAGTNTPGIEGDEYAYYLAANYDSERWFLNATYTEVAPGFNPEMGFLRRTAYRKPSAVVLYRYRPADFLGLLELRPHASYQGFWDFDGFQETGRLHVDNHWEWPSGFEVHTGFNVTREGVKAAFEIAEGVVVPAETYDHAEAQLVLVTNEGRKVSLTTHAVIGGFFGGSRVSLSPTLRLRTGEAFTTELGLQHNAVDLPGGDFTANLLRARLSYAFTPRIYVQGLVQYNDVADLWSANVRFGWLQAANTGLFVVFNQANDLDVLTGTPQARSMTVKYSRMFNVLR
ncbi:MAG: DUF5916 domain-containing protein [Rhodothermales bacterium]|nr:DUF5916 domain-containing protein [Rhodothermales bacterium]